MKRKVIKQGNGTLTITLPKEWTREVGITANDELEVDVQGNSMSVSTEGEKSVEKKSIDIKGNEWSAARIVSALYKQGCDELEVSFSDRAAVKKIQKEVKDHLMTFELVDQRANSCTLKSLARENYSDFDKMLRKSFQVGLSLAKNSLEDIKAGSLENLPELIELEKANNKFTSFCQRLIIKHGYSSRRRGVFMYLLIWQLEKVVDNYKYLIQHVSKKGKKLDAKTLKIYKEVNDFFEAFYDMFYRKDFKMVKSFASEKDMLVKKCYELMSDKKQDSVVIHQLISIVGDVFDLTGPYYALNL